MNEEWTVESWLAHKQHQQFHYKMEKFQYALELMGRPERSFPVIHVAGTNGKGSTVAFLSQLFQEHGLKVGSFVSPHMVSVHDRICINGLPISDEAFQDVAKELAVVEETVAKQYESFSYFETMTLMMFLYFSRQLLDVAVIEVGIGGLHDVTNVVEPMVSVITSIGMDHQEMLGTTLASIAQQKAGIIKKGCPVVTGPLPNEAQQVVEEIANRFMSPLFSAGNDFSLQNGQFVSKDLSISDVTVGLAGQHQLDNAAVAVEAFSLFMKETNRLVHKEAIRKALFETTWAGRMEQVASRPTIYLDGAHNVPGIQQLAQFVTSFSGSPCTILFSALERKDVEEMLDCLKANVPNAQIVLTRFSHHEAIALPTEFGCEYIEDYQAFIHQWQTVSPAEAVLWVTGSLYFISEVRQKLITKQTH